MSDSYDSSYASEVAELNSATTEYLDAIDEMVAAGLLEKQEVDALDAQLRKPWPDPPKVPKDENPFEWTPEDHYVLEDSRGMNDQVVNMTALCDDFAGTSII